MTVVFGVTSFSASCGEFGESSSSVCGTIGLIGHDALKGQEQGRKHCSIRRVLCASSPRLALTIVFVRAYRDSTPPPASFASHAVRDLLCMCSTIRSSNSLTDSGLSYPSDQRIYGHLAVKVFSGCLRCLSSLDVTRADCGFIFGRATFHDVLLIPRLVFAASMPMERRYPPPPGAQHSFSCEAAEFY